MSKFDVDLGSFAKSPPKLAHLGFASIEDLVKYLGAGLEEMRTRAESLPWFERGAKGWKWNFAGRLLFERLVKYHPTLDTFFRKLAGTFFGMLNDELGRGPVTMLDAAGGERHVTRRFGKPEKVVEFRLVGADGEERAYTDFGFIARNPQGLWAAMLVEIKMPAALRGVAAQFAEFLPQMKEARTVIAIIEGDGGPRRAEIDPRDFVFSQHGLAQIAVSPLPERQIREAFPSGGFSPAQVGNVERIDLATSGSSQVIYYKGSAAGAARLAGRPRQGNYGLSKRIRFAGAPMSAASGRVPLRPRGPRVALGPAGTF